MCGVLCMVAWVIPPFDHPLLCFLSGCDRKSGDALGVVDSGSFTRVCRFGERCDFLGGRGLGSSCSTLILR